MKWKRLIVIKKSQIVIKHSSKWKKNLIAQNTTACCILVFTHCFYTVLSRTEWHFKHYFHTMTMHFYTDVNQISWNHCFYHVKLETHQPDQWVLYTWEITMRDSQSQHVFNLPNSLCLPFETLFDYI